MITFPTPRTVAPRTVAGVTLSQTLALMLPAVAVAWSAPLQFVALFLVAVVAALAWEVLFCLVRKRGLSFHGITTALIVTILCPPDLAYWQLILAISLGVVLAEQVFGGRGFGFLSPATVVLSLLMISFPQVELPIPGAMLGLATVPGAVLLLLMGLVCWRVMLGAGVAAGVLLSIGGPLTDPGAVAATLAFGLVFLVCDPTASSTTRAGRWLYGVLAGGLFVNFSQGAILPFEAMVFAALLASIFAPLLDRLVILAHAYRRHGGNKRGGKRRAGNKGGGRHA